MQLSFHLRGPLEVFLSLRDKKLEAHAQSEALLANCAELAIRASPQNTVIAPSLEIFSDKLRIRRIDSKYLSFSSDVGNFQTKSGNTAHLAKIVTRVFFFLRMP